MREQLRFLRSEMRLITGRRRNRAGVLVLMAVPVLIAVAIRSSGSGSGSGGPGGGPDFVGQITENGVFVAFAALAIEMGLFLPMAVAVVSGDAVAGEANTGTLRYLLTVPVSRGRLLAVKYASLVLTGLIGVLAVVVTGALVGAALFGTGPLTTVSGTTIPLVEGLGRLLLASLYVTAGLAALAAFGLFVSTLTEQPIAVIVVVMIFSTTSWVLDNIPQLAALHPWLLVHRWPAMSDVMRDPVYWTTMRTGLLVDLAYTAVFLTAAWATFSTKDVTS